MKIIGGKDYYDTGARHGVDSTAVFVRSKDSTLVDAEFKADALDRIGLLRPSIMNPEMNVIEIGGERWDIRAFTIIVAGKRYGGVACVPVPRWAPGASQPSADERPVLHWSYDGYQDWYVSKGAAAITTDERASPRQQVFARHFSRELSQDQVQWLIEHKVVVATCIDGDRGRDYSLLWRVNGDNLKDFHFYHLIGADQLFQEISQWVGGVLGGPSPETVEIRDDVVLRDKRGFDEKSFKKGKQVGSKRRRVRDRQADA